MQDFLRDEFFIKLVSNPDEDTRHYWQKWLEKYGEMQQAYEVDVWNARPTGLCRAHCIILECPHNGRR